MALRAAHKEIERLKAVLDANGHPHGKSQLDEQQQLARLEGSEHQPQLNEQRQQQQLAKLEGALRQAMADYQMLLKGRSRRLLQLF